MRHIPESCNNFIVASGKSVPSLKGYKFKRTTEDSELVYKLDEYNFVTEIKGVPHRVIEYTEN